ncbi:hypothetical protein L1987_25294 [Smallanthus sonchifolius]|uniref:Uncharacterized protein n=1 Tax=Smallanthus sonchifolius TaxID=185202 RepID=A0ACB9INR9_9ASTR|nr:hypothetical protein L1987_25294 [Smallanthus sonchifolius]
MPSTSDGITTTNWIQISHGSSLHDTDSMPKTATVPLHLIRNLPHPLSHTLDLSPAIPLKNQMEKSRIHRVSSIFDSWLKIPNLRCIQAVFQHHHLLWFHLL